MFEVTLSLHGHAEGGLFTHSLRSAEAACYYAAKAGIEVQLLIVLDSASHLTRCAAQKVRYSQSKILELNNKDLGASRNESVRVSESTFIAFLDGDDLISENWLVEATKYYRLLDEKNVILHTEYMVGIQDENWVRFQVESSQKEFSSFELSQNWFFCNNSFAPLSLYEALPFPTSDRQFSLGAEDWKWSADSLLAGCVHLYVPRTAYYYRRQRQRASLGHTAGIEVMRSDLFNAANIDAWGVENYLNFLPTITEVSREPKCDALRSLYSYLVKDCHALSRLPPSSQHHMTCSMSEIDDWLVADWTAQHEVDYRVYPTLARRAALTLFHPVLASREGLALMLILHQVPESCLAILLAPFYRHGGGERMVCSYLNALQKACPTDPVVLLRLRKDDVVYHELDPAITVVEVDKIFSALDICADAQRRIVLRVLIERAPSVFWTVNNDLGLDLLQEYGAAIGVASSRITSVFGPGLTRDGYSGYAVGRVPSLIDSIDFVVADNAAVLSILESMFGVDSAKTVLCPAPAASWVDKIRFGKAAGCSRKKPGTAKFKVLWYSRLDFEKRVDLLIDVASMHNPNDTVFVVYGVSTVGDVEDPSPRLKAHPSIDYRGEFSSIADFVGEDFDAYLYTSSADGFPLVLLEASAMQLPIVASDVGGIGEVISEKTGYLVADKNNPAAYVNALSLIKENPSEARERVLSLSKWLRDNRSLAHFEECIQRLVLLTKRSRRDQQH